jgi:hypothetical protein
MRISLYSQLITVYGIEKIKYVVNEIYRSKTVESDPDQAIVNRIEEDEMGGACRTNEKEERI